MCWRSIIFCVCGRSTGWSEATREKVIPFSGAGHHYSGFMPAHREKTARAYMFASVLGREIFNSHFNIFTSSRLARSSHLRYGTSPVHGIYCLPWQYLHSLFSPPCPSHATPPKQRFMLSSLINPPPGRGQRTSTAAVGVGLGAPRPPGTLLAGASQTHPSPPHPCAARSVPSPLSPLYSGKVVG